MPGQQTSTTQTQNDARPSVTGAQGPTQRLRCPQCGTVVEAQPGQTPTCPTCGYAGDQTGSTEAQAATRRSGEQTERLRCPQCETVVETAIGQTPTCPTCGFGSEPGAPEQARDAEPAAGATVPEPQRPDEPDPDAQASPEPDPRTPGTDDASPPSRSSPGPAPGARPPGQAGQDASKELQCPQCSTIVQVEPGQTPTCPNCGFSAPPP